MLRKSALRFGLAVGTATFALVWGCTSPAPEREDDGNLTDDGGVGGMRTNSGAGGAVANGGAGNVGGMTGAGGMTSTTSTTSSSTSTTTTTSTGGGTCADMCINQYPGGVSDLTALFQCSICLNCATSCDAPNNSLCDTVPNGDSCDAGGSCNDCLNSSCTQVACQSEQDQCFGQNQDCADLNDCIEACP